MRSDSCQHPGCDRETTARLVRAGDELLAGCSFHEDWVARQAVTLGRTEGPPIRLRWKGTP